jgi:hypothetical protein
MGRLQATSRSKSSHKWAGFGGRFLAVRPRGLESGHIGNIESMHITNGTISADVEYTEHEDGTWSFKLTFQDDPVPVESVDNFPARELAEEQVNYELQAASLRIAEG